MTKLTDKLRISLGRKISPEELEVIKSNDPWRSLKFRIAGDKIIKTEEHTELATTVDHSNPKRLHIQNYYVGVDISSYTQDGLLIATESSRNYPAGRPYKKNTRVYSPPGSFFGKTADRYDDLNNAFNIGGDLWVITERLPSTWNENSYQTFRVSVISSKSTKPIREMKF